MRRRMLIFFALGLVAGWTGGTLLDRVTPAAVRFLERIVPRPSPSTAP